MLRKFNHIFIIFYMVTYDFTVRIPRELNKEFLSNGDETPPLQFFKMSSSDPQVEFGLSQYRYQIYASMASFCSFLYKVKHSMSTF